jgi:hypothetical protein
MKKSEYKDAIHTVKKARFHFNERLQNANWPCGHDDMMCERFQSGEEDFLKDKPQVVIGLELLTHVDGLEWREAEAKHFKEYWSTLYLQRFSKKAVA